MRHDTGPTFYAWLVRQARRDDPVGDIARDFMEDHFVPYQGATLEVYRDYLIGLGASQLAIEALEQAWDEWLR